MTKLCNTWLWYATGAKWKITSLKVPLGINGCVRFLFYQSFSLWSRYFDKHIFQLNVLIMSRTCSRENPHSVGALMLDIARNRPYLKCKWLERNSNPQPLSSYTNTQPFSQNDILAKWLSVCLQTKWLWVRVPLQSHFSTCMFYLVLQSNIPKNTSECLFW